MILRSLIEGFDRKQLRWCTGQETELAGSAAQAVVALATGIERSGDPAIRRWLARGRAGAPSRPQEWLPRIQDALGFSALGGGLGALRYWEQTGAPPAGWIAAADPVWLEAGMTRLRLHALPELPDDDVRATFELLQSQLGAERFVNVGAAGYFRSPHPIPTSEVSPALAQGGAPEEHLPGREAAREHDLLLSEVQMCLHDSAVNRRRLAAGAPPLNALWIWGGGDAPPAEERKLPPLFADDPVVRGFWRSSSAGAEAWPGTIRACLGAARGSFVAVAPPGNTDQVLAELREVMAGGAIGRLVLLFADGASVELRRADRFRFWRR